MPTWQGAAAHTPSRAHQDADMPARYGRQAPDCRGRDCDGSGACACAGLQGTRLQQPNGKQFIAMQKSTRVPQSAMNLLSIGGSDPSSGAGIQADIKTFEAHGAYGLCAVTAITAQNTTRFAGSEPVSARMLESQLDSILSDFELSGIKIGMVYTSQAAEIIADRLAVIAGSIPVVVDPVIQSTTGGPLLRDGALADYVRRIVPLATVVTPNLQEARMVLGAYSQDGHGQEQQQDTYDGRETDGSIQNHHTGGGVDDHIMTASEIVRKTGARSAVITGLENMGGGGRTIYDVIAVRGKRDGIKTHRLPGRPVTPEVTHGGGCAHSAVILYHLARGSDVLDAARMAQRYVARRMASPAGPGAGMRIISPPPGAIDQMHTGLSYAISQFASIAKIYRHIPECQTNFVYARQGARTTADVLGVQGRIVRTGSTVTVAGALAYGGSKHVATAVIAVSQRFPCTRSAANIKYDQNTMDALGRAGMSALTYDRDKEPRGTKESGSTIRWGITEAVKSAPVAPDAICHGGDHGKEPMIVVFGESPDDVISKIKKIIRHYRSRQRA